MNLYKYKAQNLEGNITIGQSWCSSEYDLLKTVREKGLFLISYNVNKNKRNIFSKKISVKQLALMCDYFYSLMSAGINMVEVLNILEAQIDNSKINKSLKEIGDMVRQGMQLSSSMAMYPHIYPGFLVNMITIGEEGGKLDVVFKKLSMLYYKENTVKNKLVKALIYPCTLFIISIITVQLMIIFIVPTFMNLLISFNAEIPLSTKIIYHIGDFVNRNIIGLLIILIFAIIGINYLRKFHEVNRYYHNFVYKSILTKKLSSVIGGLKFARYFGLLLGSGVQVIRALELTSNIIGSSFLSDKINESIEKIKAGSNLQDSVGSMEVLPKLLYSMIKIGEETGTLDEMLIKSSDILEEELYNTLDKLILLIEPVMIIVLSIIIGGIIISFVLPMFSIMDSI
jgi:type IV pilus assembly protein PilC